ncbi:hypothetical protein [Microbaculum marinum]|uniref:Uncharacterized protein n=1 Tax=Microbaculum marinum TaxID=1764581 RepID=A0AAW9RQI4_9HYPH
MASPFEPPWPVVERAECYTVESATGQILVYIYFEDEPGRRGATGRLTKDEARRLAANVAKLPDLLGASAPDGRLRAPLEAALAAVDVTAPATVVYPLKLALDALDAEPPTNDKTAADDRK